MKTETQNTHLCQKLENINTAIRDNDMPEVHLMQGMRLWMKSCSKTYGVKNKICLIIQLLVKDKWKKQS